ncbi:MAG: acyltransferase [Wenzhouxiangella sp.]
MKTWLATLLWPLARLASAASGLKRLWAWTRLKVELPGLSADSVVLGPVEMHGTRRVQTGRRLYLYPGLYFETRQQGRIEIGDDVVVSRGSHLVAFDRLQIGAGSMIGEYVSIRDANHDFRQADASRPLRDSGHQAAPITIGRNVWVGRGAAILAGVDIGDHAVIAANAVVTRSVAAGAVVGGVPARPLRSTLPA